MRVFIPNGVTVDSSGGTGEIEIRGTDDTKAGPSEILQFMSGNHSNVVATCLDKKGKMVVKLDVYYV